MFIFLLKCKFKGVKSDFFQTKGLQNVYFENMDFKSCLIVCNIKN